MWTDFQNFVTSRSVGNSPWTNHKDFHLTSNMLLHYLVKVENPKYIADFDSIFNKLLTCS